MPDWECAVSKALPVRSMLCKAIIQNKHYSSFQPFFSTYLFFFLFERGSLSSCSSGWHWIYYVDLELKVFAPWPLKWCDYRHVPLWPAYHCFHFIILFLFACACVCALASRCPWRQEEDVGVTGSCEPPGVCPLQELCTLSWEDTPLAPFLAFS